MKKFGAELKKSVPYRKKRVLFLFLHLQQILDIRDLVSYPEFEKTLLNFGQNPETGSSYQPQIFKWKFNMNVY